MAARARCQQFILVVALNPLDGYRVASRAGSVGREELDPLGASLARRQYGVISRTLAPTSGGKSKLLLPIGRRMVE